jgi:F420-dependent oxidoreductase-like protein
MKLGISMAYWGLGYTKDDQRTIAIEAERLGYDSLWIAEAYGSDAVSVLGWLAGCTTRIGLGSAIMQIPGRPPTMTAMAATTLDNLSDGRFQLGLGLSGPQVSEGWYGVGFGKQLQRTREYVDVVRMALARERVSYTGQSIQLPLPDGPGKALKLTIPPVQPRVPILLAAIGPKNVALAGEIADGWIPTFFSPEHVEDLRAPLVEGAARAARDPAEVKICPQVTICVNDDIDIARASMRSVLALYIGGMGSRRKNFYVDLMTRYGFGEQARHVQQLYLAGRKDEAAAALPSELIDLTCLCGPADLIRERLQGYEQAGVDTLILIPAAQGADALTDQVRRIADLGADYLDETDRSELAPQG